MSGPNAGAGPGGRLLAIGGLLGIYLLTLGSVAWGDVALGLALATAVELGWRRRAARGGAVGDPDAPPDVPLHRALLAVPALAWAVVVEISRGTWEVAKYSIGLRDPVHEDLVELEIEGVTERGVALWAFISTISPGELVVDVDEERGVLVIHVLDARDPDAIRRRHHDFYVRYQSKVVP